MNISQKHKDFFQEFSDKYKKKKPNYNIFKELYGAKNEVIHSRFLVSLLNVDNSSSHCQDDLFLKEFIDKCELDNFTLNTKNAKVKKEYKNIDIYITDGKKHIIIENKIDASDQPQQLLRYIKTIYDEIEEKNKQEKQDISAQDILNKIYVIYLSPNGREPSEVSLKEGNYGFKIKGNKLVSDFDEKNRSKGLKNWVFKLDKVKVKFKCISYKKEILEWVKSIKDKIKNLKELSTIISQYEKLVEEVVTPQKTNPLVKFIAEHFDICCKLCRQDKDGNYNYKKYALECSQIDKNIQDARLYLINDFFENYVYKELEKRLENNENWELAEYIPLEKTSWGNVIHIDPKINNKYFVHYVIQPVDSIKNVCWGIQKNHSALPNIKEIIENKNIEIKKTRHRDNWWAFAEYLYNNKDYEFALYLFENNKKNIAKDFCDKILANIDELNNEVKKMNKILAREYIINDE